MEKNKELELLEIQRKSEAEARQKVRALLARKIYGDNDTEDEPVIMDYNTAKSKGDVGTMLFHKLGMGEKQEREKKLAEMMNNIDIKSTVSELRDIDGKISDTELKLKLTIEQLQEQALKDFKAKTKDMNNTGYKYILLEQEFYDSLERIGEVEAVRTLRNNLQALKNRKSDLNKVKTKYMSDNDAMIKEAIRIKKMAEIQNSRLLDDID